MFDREKRCTEIGNAVRAIRKFFNDERFADCILGLKMGTFTHDMAVFIRKNDKIHVVLHFDPNRQTSSTLMDRFHQDLGPHVLRRGYHSRDGNVGAICSYHSWMELLRFILLKENPFTYLKRILIFDLVSKKYYSKSKLKRLNDDRNAKKR